MSMTRKSITVTNQQEQWIQAEMAKGHYGTDSELIREAIREKQQRIAELDEIRAILIEAKASGIAKEQDPHKILQRAKEELRQDGKL
jgi:antitoxin ParD1/3/4